MESRKLVVTFSLITLFVIAFLSFGITFGTEQGSSINIANETRIVNLLTGANSTVYSHSGSDNLQEVANSTTTAFDQQDEGGSGIIGEFILDSILGVGKTILGIVSTMFDAILDPLLSLIIPYQPIRNVVGIILSSILLITMVLVTWRLIKTGT